MKKLEERILRDGQVLGENILKVDSFLTHQVDFSLMKEIGQVFAEAVKDAGITKVVTIEASGIAPAVYVAEALGLPMIFAKKAKAAAFAASTAAESGLLDCSPVVEPPTCVVGC